MVLCVVEFTNVASAFMDMQNIMLSATSTDFNVDNKYGRVDDSCPDYWYINEKIARSSFYS